MSGLINFEGGESNKTTMSSVQLVDVINEYRKIEGNNTVLRHIDFMVKIEKELDSDCENFRSEYKASNNQMYKCYSLPRDECVLMLMSESRIVRKGVLLRLNALEATTPKKPITEFKIPTDFIEAMELATFALKDNQRLLSENSEMQPKALAYDKVIDNKTTYTLASLADISGIGRTTVTKLLREFGWMKAVSRSGTESTQYAKDMGYAKTIFETVPINGKEIKKKQFVLFRKGIDRFLIKI